MWKRGRAAIFLLRATLLIKNPQEAEWDHRDRETLDILRVHFLWAQPEIFVVCETSMHRTAVKWWPCTLTAENFRSSFFFLFFKKGSLCSLRSKCKIILKITLFRLHPQPFSTSVIFVFWASRFFSVQSLLRASLRVWLLAKNNPEQPTLSS